jgi:D-serine deaminase-like pyridoxal phosphate-dependent protein
MSVIQQIPTPALVLDLDLFETNLTRMAEHVKTAGKSLRPHAKAHKCPEIAKRQIALGAIGVCCATVPEVELMTAAGIPGILLTSPLADPLKMARVVAAGAMAVVDNAQQATWYDEVAKAVTCWWIWMWEITGLARGRRNRHWRSRSRWTQRRTWN